MITNALCVPITKLNFVEACGVMDIIQRRHPFSNLENIHDDNIR